MSTPCVRSPRTTSVAYHNSSPRLPSPLNPAPSSFSPPNPTGYAPGNSPFNEMSDTLSPLRERLDSGLTISPRTSPSAPRPRASSFSRSPERSHIMPPQPHRAYAHHSSPGGSPFVQGIPFPSSSPLSSSSLVGQSQSSMLHNQRSFSPPSSSRPGSPASIHCTYSQFQTRPFRSPTHHASSQIHLSQVSLSQTSSPRYTRTQSLIQQSFGTPHAGHAAASLADNTRGRRISLGAETRPHQSARGSPIAVDNSSIQDTSIAVKGRSTPLNEAPIRWWGGRTGWVDDWDIFAQQSHGTCDFYATPFSGQLDGAMGMAFIQPGYGSPSTFREPFGHGGGSPGAFLDEEIRASLDDARGIDAGFAEPLSPGLVHAPMGTNTGYRMDGIPVSPAVPMLMASGSARSRGPGYSEVVVGPLPADGGFSMQKAADELTRCHSCHASSHGNARGGNPDGPITHEHELRHAGRSRRFSDASTHSSTSYASCLSGPSQSQSHSLLVSPSHTSTCPSLSSLGIGIEEAEREGLRSRSIWRRRNSGSTMKRHSRGLSNSINGHDEEAGPGCRCSHSVREDFPEGVCASDVKAGDVVEHTGATDSKQLATQTQDKDVVRHRFVFSRVGARQGNVLDEQAQREGYITAEKYVSLAVTSILPPAAITHLSLVGEALVKARNSAKYVGHELGPLLKDTLSVSTEVLALAPLPGLEEAAKALLCVWDACQKVDTNRLACLRLAERCATLLYSVRCEINEAGAETALGLAEPVEKLCGALVQIRTFLETQLHRPFLKRYVRREEIARELQACNEAITDAGSRFGLSVQIRTYQEVVSMMKESKRWFAQEAQALVLLDHQMMQRHYAMMYGSQAPRQQVVGFPSGNALGLSMDGEVMGEGRNGDREGCLSPPPVHGPSSSIMRGVISTEVAGLSGHPTSTSSIVSTGLSSDGTDSAVLTTPTLTRATFVMEETQTKITPTHPTCPMQALAQVHRAQDAIDAAADEAALRGTLTGALDAQNDVEMVRCLQVGRGEISEAAETLRRTLGTAAEGCDDGNKHVTPGCREQGVDKGHTELDRKFMQSGIEAMTRLTNVVAKRPQDEGGHIEHEDAVPGAAQDLPTWTITRYEVIRTRKIGLGFFSDVYLGHWHKLDVVIKVLAHSVSREAFVRYVELWNRLDHPNVLPLYGASSAMGEKPWFFVSKFCGGGNLVEWLKRARMERTMTAGNEVCLLKRMYEIAKGMAYLHGCGILHGDLRVANVLVDENGQCVVSDFAQCGIKSEAHRSCGQPAPRPVRWTAPEMLIGNDQQTCATDMYAFAMCCIEILGMGEVPWTTLNDKAIRELVLDKDERPTIPVPAGCAETASAMASLIQSCWVREPDHRPTFANVASSLEEICRLHERNGSPIRLPSTPVANIRLEPVTPTESSPGEEQYETASESMMTEVEEERIDCMMDIPLTSPVAVLGHVKVARSVTHITTNDHTGVVKFSGRDSSSFLKRRDTETHIPPLTDRLDVNMSYEVKYRFIMESNHSFHSSLTLPLWSPTRVELGAVGYLSKPKGEFVTLFNAMDPLQSREERLRQLPSMYGYGKVEVHKREDGKRSVAQRGLDAISGFLTFKTRNDRSHPERITRQYTFPLIQGTPSANLCVEKTMHRYFDGLEVPKMWFKQHADLIFEVLSSRHGIHKEDLILVVGTLDAPDWAMFVSDDHSDGRVQFSVFSGREKGEPWGMYSMEQPIKGVADGPTRWVDAKHGSLASKISCVTSGGHDVVGDTVMLTGLRFGLGQESPTLI